MFEPSRQSNFEIEQIVSDKIIEGSLFYFVKWRAYPSEQNTWEPEEHLKNVPEQISLWKQKKRKIQKLSRQNNKRKNQSEDSFKGQNYTDKKHKIQKLKQFTKSPKQIDKSSKQFTQLPNILKGQSKYTNFTDKLKDFSRQKDEDTLSFNSDGTEYRGKKRNRQRLKSSLASIMSQIKELQSSRFLIKDNQKKDNKQRPEEKKKSLQAIASSIKSKTHKEHNDANPSKIKDRNTNSKVMDKSDNQKQPKEMNPKKTIKQKSQRDQLKKKQINKKDPKNKNKSAKASQNSKVKDSTGTGKTEKQKKTMNTYSKASFSRQQQKNVYNQSISGQSSLFDILNQKGISQIRRKNKKKAKKGDDSYQKKNHNTKQKMNSQFQDRKNKTQSKPQIYNEIIEFKAKDSFSKNRARGKYTKYQRENYQLQEQQSFQLSFDEVRSRRYKSRNSDFKRENRMHKRHEPSKKQSFAWLQSCSKESTQNNPLQILQILQSSAESRPKVYDQLEQIALPPSQRLPKFLSALGSKRQENKEDNLANQNKLDRKNQRHRNQRMIDNPIQIESSNNDSNSIAVIEENQFLSNMAAPKKKILLNEGSIKKSQTITKRQKQDQQNTKKTNTQTQYKKKSDPRLVIRAKDAAHNLYSFIQNHPTKWWLKEHTVYIKEIKDSVRLQDCNMQLSQDSNYQFPFQDNTVKTIPQSGSIHQSGSTALSKSVAQSKIVAYSKQQYTQTDKIVQQTQKRAIQRQDMAQQQQGESGQPDILQSIEQQIRLLFQERYPDISISLNIQDQIKRIVKKIAYEDMEIEKGLEYIQNWTQKYRKQSQVAQTLKLSPQNNEGKTKKNQEENQDSFDLYETIKKDDLHKNYPDRNNLIVEQKNQISKYYHRRHEDISSDPQQGQMILQEPRDYSKNNTSSSMSDKNDLKAKTCNNKYTESSFKKHQHHMEGLKKMQNQKMCSPISTNCKQQDNQADYKIFQHRSKIKEQFSSAYPAQSYKQTPTYDRQLASKEKKDKRQTSQNLISPQISKKQTTRGPKGLINAENDKNRPKQVDSQSIVKIVESFKYKGQVCFKVLLNNGKTVNAHYCEVKKFCKSLLIEYYYEKQQLDLFKQKQAKAVQ